MTSIAARTIEPVPTMPFANLPPIEREITRPAESRRIDAEGLSRILGICPELLMWNQKYRPDLLPKAGRDGLWDLARALEWRAAQGETVVFSN